MSTYPIQELLVMWERSRLSVVQAVGHAFQHLNDHVQRIRALEQRLRALEDQLNIEK